MHEHLVLTGIPYHKAGCLFILYQFKMLEIKSGETYFGLPRVII